MIFERKITKSGDSKAIILPIDAAKFADLDYGTPILIKAEEGKHGKFISFWRKDQKEHELESKTKCPDQ